MVVETCISTRKKERKVKLLSCVQLFATPWAVAYHAPPSMGFSRQEYWSGLPFPSPGNLPNPGIKSGSTELQADYLPSEPLGKPLSSASTRVKLLPLQAADLEQPLKGVHGRNQ